MAICDPESTCQSCLSVSRAWCCLSHVSVRPRYKWNCGWVQISTFACFVSNRIRARQSTGEGVVLPRAPGLAARAAPGACWRLAASQQGIGLTNIGPETCHFRPCIRPCTSQ
jgi:hypothetical protein